MFYARGLYARPPEDRFAITPGRIVFLVLVAVTSAVLAFLAGRSIGADTAVPSSLSGANVSHRDEALSTRLAPVPAIGALDIPKPPPPEPTATTPTTTSTQPTTDQFNSAPQQSAPSPSPAPAPAPTPAPSAPSGGGGGGSFDDSG